jgi:excisionase family DNA binding protein
LGASLRTWAKKRKRLSHPPYSRKSERRKLSSVNDREETVTVKWAADRLKVSEMTVLRYIEEGLFRAYQMKARGWWRIVKSSLLQYEQKQKGGQ